MRQAATFAVRTMTPTVSSASRKWSPNRRRESGPDRRDYEEPKANTQHNRYEREQSVVRSGRRTDRHRSGPGAVNASSTYAAGLRGGVFTVPPPVDAVHYSRACRGAGDKRKTELWNHYSFNLFRLRDLRTRRRRDCRARGRGCRARGRGCRARGRGCRARSPRCVRSRLVDVRLRHRCLRADSRSRAGRCVLSRLRCNRLKADLPLDGCAQRGVRCG